MKKLLFIVLLLTYGFSSSGISLEFHFCCGKLKDIAWTHEADKHCDHQESMGDMPCCEYKYFSIQEDRDYDKNPDPTQLSKLSGAETPTPHFAADQLFSRLKPLLHTDLPPSFFSNHLFILYCHFRI